VVRRLQDLLAEGDALLDHDPDSQGVLSRQRQSNGSIISTQLLHKRRKLQIIPADTLEQCQLDCEHNLPCNGVTVSSTGECRLHLPGRPTNVSRFYFGPCAAKRSVIHVIDGVLLDGSDIDYQCYTYRYTTTTTTTTSSLTNSVVVEGQVTLQVSDPAVIVDNPSTWPALAKGIADAISGVESSMVTITGVSLARRLEGSGRLLTSSGGLVIDYSITAPDSVGLDANTITSAAADMQSTFQAALSESNIDVVVTAAVEVSEPVVIFFTTSTSSSIRCSNVELLTSDGFSKLGDDEWWYQPGAVLFWILIAVQVTVTISIGERYSAQKQLRGWRDEYLLTSSVAFSDKTRKDVKTALLIDGEKPTPSEPPVFTLPGMSNTLACQCKLLAVAWQQGVHHEDLGVILKGAVNKRVIDESKARRAWSNQDVGKVIYDPAKLAVAAAVKDLASETKKLLEDPKDKKKKWREEGFLHRTWVLFRAGHSWLSLGRFSFTVPPPFRALMLHMRMHGSLFCNAILLSIAGASSKDGGDACNPVEFWENLGSNIVIAIVSGILSLVPLALIGMPAFRQFIYRDPWNETAKLNFLQKQRVQHRILWFVGLSYVFFCSLFVSVFLANAGDGSSADWLTAGFTNLIMSVIINPLIWALILAAFNESQPKQVRRQVLEMELNLAHLLKDSEEERKAAVDPLPVVDAADGDDGKSAGKSAAGADVPQAPPTVRPVEKPKITGIRAVDKHLVRPKSKEKPTVPVELRPAKVDPPPVPTDRPPPLVPPKPGHCPSFLDSEENTPAGGVPNYVRFAPSKDGVPPPLPGLPPDQPPPLPIDTGRRDMSPMVISRSAGMWGVRGQRWVQLQDRRYSATSLARGSMAGPDSPGLEAPPNAADFREIQSPTRLPSGPFSPSSTRLQSAPASPIKLFGEQLSPTRLVPGEQFSPTRLVPGEQLSPTRLVPGEQQSPTRLVVLGEQTPTRSPSRRTPAIASIPEGAIPEVAAIPGGVPETVVEGDNEDDSRPNSSASVYRVQPHVLE